MSIETISAQFDVCVGTVHNYSLGAEDAEDLREVCLKGAQRRSERKTLSWQQGDGRADQFRSRSSWCSGDLRWMLDRLLWPRDQETEFPVEACGLSHTQEGQTKQIDPQTFDDLFFDSTSMINIHWVPTGQTVNKEYSVEVLREFRKRFRRKRSALFKSGQWHFHQDNAPVDNSILVTDYLTKMGIKTVPNHPYSRDLAPCDFWFSLSSRKSLEAVVMRELRRWKRLWRRSLTRSHKRTSMGPCRSCWNSTTSALQPEINSKGTRVSCVYYQ